MRYLVRLCVLAVVVVAVAACRVGPPETVLETSEPGQAQTGPIRLGCPNSTLDSCFRVDWAPDSSQIVFEMGELDHVALVVADADLTQANRLVGADIPVVIPTRRAHPAGNGTPAPEQLKPDGGVTAQVQLETVVIAPRSPSGETAILGQLYYPAWSPDGSTIAFYYEPSSSGMPKQGIYFIDADGQNMRLSLALPAGLRSGPDWSSDGRRLMYVDGDGGIIIVNVDGTGEQRIKFGLAADVAAWSPDDTRIAVIAGGLDTADLFVMNADGSNVRNLTNNGASEFEQELSWSPDSQRLVYTGFSREPNRDFLYVIDVDGTGKRLVDATYNYGPVAWSPDGSWLILAAKEDRPNCLCPWFFVKLRADF